MVFIRKKRQQNKRLLRQLIDSDTEFMIGQNSHETQPGYGGNTVNESTTLNNVKNLIQVNSSQVDVHTLENNLVNKIRSEVDKVMTSVETRVQDVVLTAIENLVISRVELAMKSVNASSGRGAFNIVLDPDWIVLY